MIGTGSAHGANQVSEPQCGEAVHRRGYLRIVLVIAGVLHFAWFQSPALAAEDLPGWMQQMEGQALWRVRPHSFAHRLYRLAEQIRAEGSPADHALSRADLDAATVLQQYPRLRSAHGLDRVSKGMNLAGAGAILLGVHALLRGCAGPVTWAIPGSEVALSLSSHLAQDVGLLAMLLGNTVRDESLRWMLLGRNAAALRKQVAETITDAGIHGMWKGEPHMAPATTAAAHVAATVLNGVHVEDANGDWPTRVPRARMLPGRKATALESQAAGLTLEMLLGPGRIALAKRAVDLLVAGAGAHLAETPWVLNLGLPQRAYQLPPETRLALVESAPQLLDAAASAILQPQ